MSFHKEKKVADAVFPRSVGTTTLPSDRLKIVYDKYKSTKTALDGTTIVNLIFAHGTGMNKSVWNIHIRKLFELSERSSWKIGAVISIDSVSHGDSGLLNRPYLGWTSGWLDGARDLIAVVKYEIETRSDFVPSAYSRNILVGHSMGGFLATYAGYLEPSLFDSVIAVEPVLVYDSSHTKVFLKRVKKLALLLRDSFASEEDANTWYKRISFYSEMEKEALDEFVADEVIAENGNYISKASVRSQLASYISAVLDVESGQTILKHLRIPFFHIIGKSAQWNPPEAVKYIRNTVPYNLLETADLDGAHLVHVTNVQDTVDAIAVFVDRRATFVTENRLNFPEVRFNNDRKAILEHKWAEVLQGNVKQSVSYSVSLNGGAKL